MNQDYYVKTGDNAIYYKQTQINGGTITTVQTQLDYTKGVKTILGIAGLFFLGKTAVNAITSAAGKFEVFKKILDVVPAFG